MQIDVAEKDGVAKITVATEPITTVIDCSGPVTITFQDKDGSQVGLLEDLTESTSLKIKSDGEVEIGGE